MFGSLRNYNLRPGTIESLIPRIQTGFVPLIRQAPGFVSYGLATASNDRLITFSVFETKDGADESARLAAGWVQENMAAAIRNPPEILAGAVRIRSVTKTPRYVVLRRYWTEPRNVDEVVKRAQDGFLPIIGKLPGFATYTALDIGDGNLITLSGFDDQASAEESVRAAAAWVKPNLGPLLPNSPIVTAVDVRFMVVA